MRTDPLFQKLLRQLQDVAERSLLEQLVESEKFRVMGPLPNAVEVERQRCLSGGIPDDLVDNIVNLAWQTACDRHKTLLEEAIAIIKSLRGRLHKTHSKHPSTSLKPDECNVCGSKVNDFTRRGERLLLKRRTLT